VNIFVAKIIKIFKMVLYSKSPISKKTRSTFFLIFLCLEAFAENVHVNLKQSMTDKDMNKSIITLI